MQNKKLCMASARQRANSLQFGGHLSAETYRPFCFRRGSHAGACRRRDESLRTDWPPKISQRSRTAALQRGRAKAPPSAPPLLDARRERRLKRHKRGIVRQASLRRRPDRAVRHPAGTSHTDVIGGRRNELSRHICEVASLRIPPGVIQCRRSECILDATLIVSHRTGSCWM